MPGYKHPCRHCGKLVPPDANVCPFCGKVEPRGPSRCPKCRTPIEEGWVRCSSCGLKLEIACPHCGRPTFFGDYCGNCDGRLTVVCPHPKCGIEQPPLGDRCAKCGKPLKAKSSPTPGEIP
jgi:hypothetical protein